MCYSLQPNLRIIPPMLRLWECRPLRQILDGTHAHHSTCPRDAETLAIKVWKTLKTADAIIRRRGLCAATRTSAASCVQCMKIYATSLFCRGWDLPEQETVLAANAQPSARLGVQRYGPFCIIELIQKNSVPVKLPYSIRIRPVIYVEHTLRRQRQPNDLIDEESEPAKPFIDDKGELVVKVDKTISHRKKSVGDSSSLHYIRTHPLMKRIENSFVTSWTKTERLLRHYIDT